MRWVSVAAIAALPVSAAAQNGAIVGVIVDRVSTAPLAYGIVELPQLELSAFTTESGTFAFRGLREGTWTLSVRRLGYLPREVRVEVRADGVDTVRVDLARVAVNLVGVTVRAYPPCTRPGPPDPSDSTLVTIVQQLKLNAEQYRFLARQYPYEYTSVIDRSRTTRDGEITMRDMPVTQLIESRIQPTYRPGGAIQRRGSNLVFRIPGLVDVADRAFINAHCWHYGGTELYEDLEMLRIDIVASDRLRSPDVNGSFLIHPVTFQIVRSSMSLSRRTRLVPDMLDLQTTTEFFQVLPSVPIIYKVSSVMTMDPERKTRESHIYEEHRTTDFRWVGRKPGDANQVPPSQRP